VALRQVDADCLVLEPERWAALRPLPLLLAGAAGPVAGLVYLLLEEGRGNAGGVGAIILGAGSLAVSALLLAAALAPRGFHRWVRFDRRTGLMTVSRRPVGFRRRLQAVRSHRLADIVGVQLMYAGWQSEAVEIGEPGAPGSVTYRNYHAYQLNLVVADRAEPRLNLCSHSDPAWMREAGQRLAGFLGVPVLDQLPRGH